MINRRQYPPMCTSSCEKNVVNSFEKYSIECKINVKSFLAYLIRIVSTSSRSLHSREIVLPRDLDISIISNPCLRKVCILLYIQR